LPALPLRELEWHGRQPPETWDRGTAFQTLPVAIRRSWCVAGLVLLVAASNLIVAGAKGIAISFGIDEFIVGAA
jgi:Ca2+/Na+ antiporter